MSIVACPSGKNDPTGLWIEIATGIPFVVIARRGRDVVLLHTLYQTIDTLHRPRLRVHRGIEKCIWFDTIRENDAKKTQHISHRVQRSCNVSIWPWKRRPDFDSVYNTAWTYDIDADRLRDLRSTAANILDEYYMQTRARNKACSCTCFGLGGNLQKELCEVGCSLLRGESPAREVTGGCCACNFSCHN